MRGVMRSSYAFGSARTEETRVLGVLLTRRAAQRQIDPHSSNLVHDFPSRYQIELRKLNLGTSMPCGLKPASSRRSPFHSLG